LPSKGAYSTIYIGTFMGAQPKSVIIKQLKDDFYI
jgi:hypothetical protein